MKLDTFFEKFDQFADAPDAVERMRELVLELAVQGKLVGQDPNDDSADELLRQIELTKGRTSRIANGRKLEVLPPIEPGDSPFEVPHGWAWCRLGTLGLIGSSCRVHEKDWTTRGVPFLRAREIVRLAKSGQVDNDLFITEQHYQRLASEGLIPEPNDLMITGVGTIGVPYVVSDSDRFYFKDASVLIFKNWFGLYPHFLHIVMQSPYWIREVHRESMGTTVHTLTIVRAKQTPIPLPPLAEQKRIVAKVDELMALCDRLEAQQQERETRHAALARASLSRFADAPTPANLHFLFHPSYPIPPADLRKSILTLAVQGKLVSQDPNDEPAQEILTGIAGDVAKAVRAKRMRNSRPIPKYEDEFPFDLPAGWAWAPLGILTAAEDGAMCDGPFGSKLKTEHYIPAKGFSVLRLGNIGVGYFIHGKEGHISREHFESLRSNHTAPGDLLVAGLADPLVRCCEIPADIGPAVNKSDCFRVRLSERMDRSYVRHYLNSPIAKSFAAEENHGMTRERINLANAKALPVPVPPLAEQRRIVAKVEQLMALVDALETQLAASRDTGEKLLSAVVAEITAN